MANGAAQQQALERAARKARDRLIAWREQQAALSLELLRLMSADIVAEIIAEADSTGRVAAHSLPTLRAYLRQRLGRFWPRWRQLLDDSLLKAVGIGASLVSLTGSPVSEVSISDGVMRYLREWRAIDGLTLSDRLWRIESGAEDSLQRAVEGAIMRGESSFAAAQRYINEGLPIPAELQGGLQAGSARVLRAAVESMLLHATGDIFYPVMRVLRTETNRAYTEAYVASVSQHPDVVGVRFRLSPLHPKTDICDLYAAANLFGLGAGVYPPGNHPYPAHPNTLSFLTTVFRDQVAANAAGSRESAFDWIRRQPEAVRQGVLGGKQKAAAFDAGMLEAGDLRRPWHEIADRLGVTA